MGTSFKVKFSTSQQVRCIYEIDKSNPSGTSQECIRYVRYKGFSLTQDSLNLLSSYLSNMDAIVYDGDGYNFLYSDISQLDSVTFDLTALQKLKSFRMKVEAVVRVRNGEKCFDYLSIHFKHEDDDEEAFYSVQGENTCFQMAAVTQEWNALKMKLF